MRSIDTFSSYHPAVNFLYFTEVLLFSMFFMHPVCLIISLIGSVCYTVNMNGQKGVLFTLKFALPMLLITALVHPAFGHEGATILYYLPTGNPLTLESVLYGIAAGLMMAAVLIWFSCYNAVMTSDKFVYLFGRVIPALSLVLSMTLRFVPKFKAQLTVVAEAQASIGRDASQGSLWQRTKKAATILSIMVTWALENAIETADSMKSRGYGLPGRTAFSIYAFDGRDKTVMGWLIFCGMYIFSGSLAGGLRWRYSPSVAGVLWQVFPVSLYITYFALCLTPVVINLKEERKWNALQSKI